MSSVVTEFPDQTYTTSNKPSVETLKSDIAALETGHNDLETTAVKLTGTQSITGVKTMTTPVLESPVIKAWSGWQLYSAVTPTYTSADDPTYVITFAAVDLTSILSVGMKVKFTNNSTTFYGFITAIAFSTNTTVTLYGGTDYDVANSAISNFYFSTDRAPHGFPLQREKWTTKATYTSDTTQSTPTSGTWYNVGTFLLNVPIGSWDLGYSASYRLNDSATAAYAFFSTLSTGNSTESDTELTFALDGLGGAIGYSSSHAVKRKPGGVTVAVKTPYYLNAKVQDTGVDSFILRGVSFPCVIDATIAYL